MEESGLSPEQVASREMLRYLVRRYVTCPLSGKVLDSRTAVLIESDSTRPIAIHPDMWVELKEQHTADAQAQGITITVTEGAA
jgi:hypothetical protein